MGPTDRVLDDMGIEYQDEGGGGSHRVVAGVMIATAAGHIADEHTGIQYFVRRTHKRGGAYLLILQINRNVSATIFSLQFVSVYPKRWHKLSSSYLICWYP